MTSSANRRLPSHVGGIDAPKPNGNPDCISTSFKIPKALHVELKIAAAKEGREMGELVEDALKAYRGVT
jgi:hypothetical protein